MLTYQALCTLGAAGNGEEEAGRAPRPRPASDGVLSLLRPNGRAFIARLQAGLLAYQPLSRGGRTVVVGEQSLSYRYEAIEVSPDLAEDVSSWLRRLALDAQASAMGVAKDMAIRYVSAPATRIIRRTRSSKPIFVLACVQPRP